MNQTSKAVASAHLSGPRVRVIDQTAEPTMAVAKKSATTPPLTAIESAVLCAVSTGAKPVAETKVSAPVPKNGARTKACQPACQMFMRSLRSPR